MLGSPGIRIARVIVIVLDSVGVGALPDAADYGDAGSNTLVHIAHRRAGLNLPNLQRLGLGNIIQVPGVPSTAEPLASYGKMQEASRGKDTMTSHWEIMGLITDKPFALFPQGFGQDILDAFRKETGVGGILGNKPASGTVIIQELGEEHLKTGFPIIYTSADSVFQIAAHERVIPLEKLYHLCEKARKICDPHMIGRVIARPFIGEKGGDFKRTANRRDFPMRPHSKTALDLIKERGLPVVGIGKIEDIFAGCGITRAVHTTDNKEGMRCLQEELSITRHGLIFINLVDFDMVYGHRNDVEGYARALEDFDAWFGGFLPQLENQDLLIISADHGCDPTHPGTDHTREYVPLLVYNPHLAAGNLGTRQTFADIGAAILKIFGIEHNLAGQSFF